VPRNKWDPQDVALLEVDNLRTYIYTRRGVNRAVDGVSFQLDRGRSLGLVGESGSGKSVTVLSMLQLAPKPVARITGGEIRFNGEDLLKKSEKEMRRIRGGDIAIILQDPLTSLNPVFNVRYQVGESVYLHQHLSGKAQLDRVIDSLRRVHVPAPEIRMNDYPHQFSGGMRQRVVGATAIACEPKVLVADEATTALDATIQAQYLALLRGLQKDLNLALLFITHDFGIVAKMCDDVAVMYAGRIVEYADVREIFNHPGHPYTLALLEAVPKVDRRVNRLYAIPGSPATGWTQSAGCSFASRCTFVFDRCTREKPPLITIKAGHSSECWRAEDVYAKSKGLMGNGNEDGGTSDLASKPIVQKLEVRPTRLNAGRGNIILQVQDLHVFFPVTRGLLFKRQTLVIRAVDGISFDIKEGETFSIVGESGCGKTTTARAILKVETPTEGRVLWHGKDIHELNAAEIRAHRSAVQAVFQDPYSSMNPRMRVGDFITEPLLINSTISKGERRERAKEVLQQVGLRADEINNFPHEFSGGQRQRIAIARALSSSPRLIVLDEPVSSLDVSIRAQIMNLLKDLQEKEGFSYLFIAHHLGTVRYMSQMVGVMYLGRLMEMSECEDLFNNPLHPYTKALFSAALPDHPDIERDELLLHGDVSAATAVPSGCRLHPRCPMAMPVCSEIEPEWKEIRPRHWTACHLY
jgi:oligopeptide/dipeptide ABC transporter ATP-binding protein